MRKSGDAADWGASAVPTATPAPAENSDDADPFRIHAPGFRVPANEPQGLLSVGDSHSQHFRQSRIVRFRVGVRVADLHLLTRPRGAGRRGSAASRACGIGLQRPVLQHECADAFAVQPFRHLAAFIVECESAQRAARRDHNGSPCGACGTGRNTVNVGSLTFVTVRSPEEDFVTVSATDHASEPGAFAGQSRIS